MICGVYMIKNMVTNDCYIGASKDTDLRKYRHLDRPSGVSGSCLLREAIAEYGRDAFQFMMVLRCKNEDLRKEEAKWIRVLKPKYNLDGAWPDGRAKRAASTKAKILAVHLGAKRSEETRAKISVSKKGPMCSAETRAKISAARLGKGHKHSAETRAKIAAAHLGKPHPHKSHKNSAETRAKISAANRGRLLGCKHSAETKYKMSKAARKRKRGKTGRWLRSI